MEQLKDLAIGLELLAITSSLVSQNTENSDIKEGLLKNQDLSAFRLPSFEVLSENINMTTEAYNTLKGKWGPLKKYDFKSHYKRFGNHTKELYAVLSTLGSGKKRLYLGQVDSPTSKVPFGMGVRISQDGQFEEGIWLDGKQHGYGRCIFSNGGVYEGHFKLDNKHGLGEDTYSSGNKFAGHYVDDKKDGDGAMHYKDGTVKRGLWINDELEREF